MISILTYSAEQIGSAQSRQHMMPSTSFEFLSVKITPICRCFVARSLEVFKRTCLSKTQVYQMIFEGRFPRWNMRPLFGRALEAMVTDPLRRCDHGWRV